LSSRSARRRHPHGQYFIVSFALGLRHHGLARRGVFRPATASSAAKVSSPIASSVLVLCRYEDDNEPHVAGRGGGRGRAFIIVPTLRRDEDNDDPRVAATTVVFGQGRGRVVVIVPTLRRDEDDDDPRVAAIAVVIGRGRGRIVVIARHPSLSLTLTFA
jgi:hypothetical protein